MTNALTVVNDKKKIGHRISKLTPEMITKMADIMSKGHYFITACNACDVSKHAAYDWIHKGEADIEKGVKSLNQDLVHALKRAEFDNEQALLAVVKDKAINDKEWIPAMTILERRHPERWGRKDRVPPTTISEDNRVVNIFVVDKDTKGLIAKVKERTGKLIEAVPEEAPERKEEE